MNKYIACCGLDCKKCEAYLATINDDDKKREEVAQKWSELNNVLITKEMINCLGCRRDGVKTPFCSSLCEIRKCVLNNKYNTCGDCDKLRDCKKLNMIIATNKDALNNLLKRGDK